MRVHRPLMVASVSLVALGIASAAFGVESLDDVKLRAQARPATNASTEKLLATPPDTYAPSEVDAVSFANSLMLRARAVFADPSLDTFSRRREVRALVSEAFDVDSLGKALLGDNLGKLDAKQMTAYRRVITDYLVPIYANKIYRACSGTPQVVAVKPYAQGYSVRTAYNIESGEAPTYVDWMLNHRTDGSWRVIDVSVAGVSLAKSKMEEFSSVISAQGTDAFLELLQSQAQETIPQPLSLPVAPAAPSGDR